MMKKALVLVIAVLAVAALTVAIHAALTSPHTYEPRHHEHIKTANYLTIPVNQVTYHDVHDINIEGENEETETTFRLHDGTLIRYTGLPPKITSNKPLALLESEVLTEQEHELHDRRAPLWHAKVLRETANELETRAGGRYGR